MTGEDFSAAARPRNDKRGRGIERTTGEARGARASSPRVSRPRWPRSFRRKRHPRTGARNRLSRGCSALARGDSPSSLRTRRTPRERACRSGPLGGAPLRGSLSTVQKLWLVRRVTSSATAVGSLTRGSGRSEHFHSHSPHRPLTCAVNGWGLSQTKRAGTATRHIAADLRKASGEGT